MQKGAHITVAQEDELLQSEYMYSATTRSSHKVFPTATHTTVNYWLACLTIVDFLSLTGAFLHLASFIQHYVFEIYPYCPFPFTLLYNILL